MNRGRLPFVVIQTERGVFEVGPDTTGDPDFLLVRSMDLVLRNRTKFTHFLASVKRGSGANVYSLVRPGRKDVTTNHYEQAQAVAVWAAGLAWQDHGAEVHAMTLQVAERRLDDARAWQARAAEDLRDARSLVRQVALEVARIRGDAQWATKADTLEIEP
jgi:hypothetical protein